LHYVTASQGQLLHIPNFQAQVLLQNTWDGYAKVSLEARFLACISVPYTVQQDKALVFGKRALVFGSELSKIFIIVHACRSVNLIPRREALRRTNILVARAEGDVSFGAQAQFSSHPVS
jgi:hypothetical protein